MSERISKVAAISYIAAIMLCILGSVKFFGPLAVIFLAVGFAADGHKKFYPTQLVIFSIPTAGAIFYGIQQHEARLGQIAYYAHRQTIGCTDADRLSVIGPPLKSDARRRPTKAEIERCGNHDDSGSFGLNLEGNGWPRVWLE